MDKFICLLFKKTKKENKAYPSTDLPAKTEYTAKAIDTNALKSLCPTVTVSQAKHHFISNVKVINYESSVRTHKTTSSDQEDDMHREYTSDSFISDSKFTKEPYYNEKAVSEAVTLQNGHAIDTRIENNELCDSVKLKHTCSCNGLSFCHSETDTESQSFDELLELNEKVSKKNVDPVSHFSITTSNQQDIYSSDKLPWNKAVKLSNRASQRERPSMKILHANAFTQSLNSSSTMARISEVKLEVIPTLSHLSGLKCVNLSKNSIAHISLGSLPKGLHTLDLSYNKITTIEGIRELPYLKVIDLSYNKISRIGHGFSNCTLLKEIYLAGNKISNVEGLHRLLKLTVLDLSFNKITKHYLDRLAANDKLLVLNLLGNPVQINLTDKQLNKIVHTLLPKLIYLNMQPIKQRCERRAYLDSAVRNAITRTSRSHRRRAKTRTSHDVSYPLRHNNGRGTVRKK